MSEWAMLSLVTIVFLEVFTYLFLMSKVAFLSILAFTMDFIFVARFYF